MMIYRILLGVYFAFQTLLSFSQNVKIYGNVVDNEGYSTVILSPSIYSKLIDSKMEANPKKGYFEFNILVPAPSFYRLYYKDKRISLYVEPGTTIQLSIDNTKSKDYLNFYSQLIGENTFLNLENTPSLGNKEQRDLLKKVASEGKEIFYQTIDEQTKKQSEIFSQMAEEYQLSMPFISLYNQNNFEMGAKLYKYFYPKFAFGNMDSFLVTNPDYSSVLADLPNSKDYNQSVIYFENQMNYLKAKVISNFRSQVLNKKLDDLELYKAYLNEASLHRDPLVREYLMENLIGEWISFYGRTTDIKEQIVSYVEPITDKVKQDQIKKRLVHLAQYESGKPAPIFSFEDYAGNIRNLRELIGKIVYIHVWSSQNKNSVDDLAYHKDIFNRYKDREDIVFLSMSVDENKESWERQVRESKLYDGLQAIAFPNGLNSDFARKYSIQSVPMGILIDKSGNIITHRAPRASQPEKLIPLLNKLLGVE